MKLLINSYAGIGDTLFAGPLLHELRLNFPDAQMDALVRWPGAADILAGNPWVNTIHQRDLAKVNVRDGFRFLRTLREQGYDMSVNSLPQSRVYYRGLARLVGAPVRISHEYDDFGWLTPLLVNRTLPIDYSVHCVENNLALLPLLDAKAKLDRHEYEIYLSDSDRQWADDFVIQNNLQGFTLLGVGVGSGSTKNLALRRWPLRYYFQLIRQLNDVRRNVAVLLFGGPDEEKDHEQLLAESDRKSVLAPRTRNLRQAAALLGKCSLFLSVDTVLMHLAAAMKVRGQIVIETPTWNKTVQPYGRPFTLVRNPAVNGKNLDYYRYDGGPIRGTPETIIATMKSVSVDSVYRAVREALEQSPSSTEL